MSSYRKASDVSRRNFLKSAAAGMVRGGWMGKGAKAESGSKAKACIVMFCWGGMSHVDTWDPKPQAGTEVRSVFQPIATSTPGVFFGEHMPKMAQQMHRLAVVRSVYHGTADHRDAAYWNLTGHEPARPGILEPSRQDWPSLGALVSKATAAQRSSVLPGTVTLPYPIADRGLLHGQYGGFLGGPFDPVFIKQKSGRPYNGVSPMAGNLNLDPVEGVDAARLNARRGLLKKLNAGQKNPSLTQAGEQLLQVQHSAMDMLLAPEVRTAFDLEAEPAKLRAQYGDHICGQSVLLARRLTEAGVPLVTAICGAGDLNGSSGDNWDTHGNGYNRLKNDLLPPWDQAGSALLNDLAQRGRLDDTLVVFLTEFGRTPQVTGDGGRNHYPNCYSVAFAGGGIRGGQVYGASDKIGSTPLVGHCTPADLHATLFRALGIDPRFTVHDFDQRPLTITDGTPLPLFG